MKHLLDKASGGPSCSTHYSLLRRAAVNGHRDVVQVLLATCTGLDPQLCTESALLGAAATRDYLEIVESLLAHGADARGPDGRLAVGIALEKKYGAIVELLEAAGASVDPEAYGALAILFDAGQGWPSSVISHRSSGKRTATWCMPLAFASSTKRLGGPTYDEPLSGTPS